MATPTPTATATQITKASTLRDVDRHLHIPVVLPANLPKGADVDGVQLYPAAQTTDGHPGRPASARVRLRLPDRRLLHVMFGHAGFDGCGPSRPQRVKVGDQPAIMQARGRRSRHTTVIWPTSKPGVDGRYGLEGPFSKAQILRWAESMERARAKALTVRAGC